MTRAEWSASPGDQAHPIVIGEWCAVADDVLLVVTYPLTHDRPRELTTGSISGIQHRCSLVSYTFTAWVRTYTSPLLT